MTRAARIVRGAGLAAAAIVAVGCGGEPTGVGGSFGGRMIAVGPTTRGLDPALVGRWSRIVLVDAAAGLTASETRWTFFADGTVERRLITSNLTLGLADQVITRGRWSTAGDGTVAIVFDDASGTTLRLPYTVVPRTDGAQLTLGGLLHERFTP